MLKPFTGTVPPNHAGRRRLRVCLWAAAFGLALFSSSCMVGPKYKRPTAPVPTTYKELPPDGSAQASTWKEAQPSDTLARGKWWEIYNDPQLNSLEEQVSISNQNILAAEAQYRAARDAVRIVRSSLFPTVATAPSIVNSRAPVTSTPGVASFAPASRTTYDLPASLSYVTDLWGGIRRSIRASAAAAQITAAQLESARLAYQAELAQAYFGLHGTDGARELLERTVKSYQEYLQLTQDRFASGVASGADVAQAQTQLETARAQLIDYGVARAQYEHAIAILVGKPPAELSITPQTIKITPPAVPVGVPSDLLERRPDIAAAERAMAAANEEIGIAKVAYYPTLGLTASAGFEGSQFSKWFSWPSRFWSVGPQLAETIFDAGRRRAQVAQTQADFDATVASYRQTVLTAFQQVEDSLAALRVLENEAQAEDLAVAAAQNSLDISTYQYKAGVASYLQVISAQTIAFQDQLAAVNIRTRRMTASVLLIEALGGGWNASKLPTAQDLISSK
jgi:NodT family efflux transporter outer membrane factor (OMF) lipoprotein